MIPVFARGPGGVGVVRAGSVLWGNVSPTALIRANQRFDFFVFPGQRHGYGNMSDYWFWLRAEYFVKHLLGDTGWDVNIAELNLEREQTGGGSR